VPKADGHVYSSPMVSNEFNGIFVGILKKRKIKSSLICWYLEKEKNQEQFVVTVSGCNLIPAA
jgi:hypothetical protein